MADSGERLPLSGVRVIDFTNAVAGPVCTQTLADMGADVIKVESPTARSPRAHGTPLPSPEIPDQPWNRLTSFNELNRGKRGLVLDAGTREGRAAFLQLARVCDVMVENFAPRVVGNLGIDYDALSAVRPDIIVVSMPAFGKSGPYRDRISYGPGIDAMSGLSHLSGYEGGSPMKPGNYFCDYNAGLLAAFSVVAALRHRDRTGAGQYIEAAMIEGEFQTIGEALLDAQMNGREGARHGNRDRSMAPHNVYPCREPDSWVAIAVGTDAEWASLCAAIDQPARALDPRYADVISRHRNQEEIDALVSEWTRQRTPGEAMRLLQAVGVQAGAALTMAELHTDPHIRARGVFHTTVHPQQGPMPHTRAAYKLSAAPTAGPRHAAPTFGQHNRELLGDLLGLNAHEQRALMESGAVSDHPRVVA